MTSYGALIDSTALSCLSATDTERAVRALSSWGCCPRCVLRFIGEKAPSVYRSLSDGELDDWIEKWTVRSSEQPMESEANDQNKFEKDQLDGNATDGGYAEGDRLKLNGGQIGEECKFAGVSVCFNIIGVVCILRLCNYLFCIKEQIKIDK